MAAAGGHAVTEGPPVLDGRPALSEDEVGNIVGDIVDNTNAWIEENAQEGLSTTDLDRIVEGLEDIINMADEKDVSDELRQVLARMSMAGALGVRRKPQTKRYTWLPADQFKKTAYEISDSFLWGDSDVFNDSDEEEERQRKQPRRRRNARQPLPLESVKLHDEIQQLVQDPATTPHERAMKVEKYQAKMQELVNMGVDTSITILRERELPRRADRTIPSVKAGGVLGGIKFIKGPLFFKVAQPCEPITKAFDAYKVARHEFRASEALQRLDIPNLVVPAQFLLRIKGHTVTVQVLVPVSEATLVYGSHDAGRTVYNDEKAHASQTAKRIAEALNLAKHEVLCEAKVWLPVDMEIHASHVDGREIAVDVSRVFPSTEVATFVKVRDKKGRVVDDFKQDDNVFHRLFRPEFLLKHCKDKPLSSDKFTIFSGGEDYGYHDADGAAAVIKLREEVIPQVVEALTPQSDLRAVLHAQGVNMRYLGEVLRHVGDQETGRHVLREMVVRAFKTRLYETFSTIKFTASDDEFVRVGEDIAAETSAARVCEWIAAKYEVAVPEQEVREALEACRETGRLREVVEKQVRGETWTMELPEFVPRERAEAMLKEALEVRAQNLGGDARYPLLVSTMRQLLELYRKWHDDEPEATAKKAEELMTEMKEVVEVLRSAVDCGDGVERKDCSVLYPLKEIALCYFYMALYLKGTARYDESVAMWKACLAVKEEQAARDGEEEHSLNMATVTQNMAVVYQRQGRYDAALEMYERALKIKEATLGADHPDVATTLNNMAIVYGNQGKYDAALEMYGRALKIYEAKLGADHPDVADTLNNMAAVYDSQGIFDAALEMYGRALKIYEAKLGADHPDVAATLNNIGEVYRNQGKYDAALEMYGRALKIYEAKLGADHPDVAATLNNMAIIHKSQGKYDAALEMYGRALKIKEAKLGADHPDVADTLNNMAIVYKKQGKYDAALEMYGCALKIKEAKLGADHPSVAGMLNNMANVYHRQGKYDAALEMYGRALKTNEAKLGADHPSVAMTLVNISLLLEQQGQIDEALEHAQRARVIYERVGHAQYLQYCDRLIAILSLDQLVATEHLVSDRQAA